MKKACSVAVLTGLLFCARHLYAHRLDEYLQATLLTIERGRVQATVRLIPGVAVSDSVIRAIDRNGDGVFSEDEERAYAQQVLSYVAVASDGQSVQPRLQSWLFPERAEIRAGVGEIRILYELEIPSGRRERSLTVSSRSADASAVFLVNVTVPSDPTLEIIEQKRNFNQAVYEVRYEDLSVKEQSPWFWRTIFAGSAALVLLIVFGVMSRLRRH